MNKLSILDLFAADAINAPAMITGGGKSKGKCKSKSKKKSKSKSKCKSKSKSKSKSGSNSKYGCGPVVPPPCYKC